MGGVNHVRHSSSYVAAMTRAPAREVFVFALFGVSSPWLWVYLMGLFAVFEVPVLSAMSRNLVSLSRKFAFSCMVGFDVFAALLCGAAISLPLGPALNAGV